MRFLALALVAGLVAGGCAAGRRGAKTEPAKPAEPAPKMIVTPEQKTAGTVLSVNPNARFAVVNFPLGSVPAVDTRLNIYRRGLKVGEIKITGPQNIDNTVG